MLIGRSREHGLGEGPAPWRPASRPGMRSTVAELSPRAKAAARGKKAALEHLSPSRLCSVLRIDTLSP